MPGAHLGKGPITLWRRLSGCLEVKKELAVQRTERSWRWPWRDAHLATENQQQKLISVVQSPALHSNPLTPHLLTPRDGEHSPPEGYAPLRSLRRDCLCTCPPLYKSVSLYWHLTWDELSWNPKHQRRTVTTALNFPTSPRGPAGCPHCEDANLCEKRTFKSLSFSISSRGTHYPM